MAGVLKVPKLSGREINRNDKENKDEEEKEKQKNETLLPVFQTPAQSSMPPSIGLYYRIASCVLFVGLSVGARLCQHWVRDLRYNFLCPIIVITLVKMAFSLSFYAAQDGPLQEIPNKLRSAQSLVWRYSAVAALYCVYDVLSFVNLANFDPQTYLFFLNLRTPLTAVVWEKVFGKPLSWIQRAALLLIVGGCMIKQSVGGLHLTSTEGNPIIACVLLLVQVVANVVAGVVNETLLKEKTAVSFNLQNFIQYTWVLAGCLSMGLIAPVEGVSLNPLDVAEWAKVLRPRMIPSIVVLASLGLTTSVLLKYLDSVWKAICTSVELFVTAFASAAVFGYPLGLMDFISLAVASVGVYVYAAPWATPPDPRLLTKTDSETSDTRSRTTKTESSK